MDVDPTIRLTFELPAALGPELLESAASLATARAASIELIDIKPKFLPVSREWVDSPESLFSDVTVYEDNRWHRIQLVTIENMRNFFEANGVDQRAPASHIINSIAGPNRANRAMLDPYVYRPLYDFRKPSSQLQREFHATAGIRVETAPELMDKIKSGTIEIKGLGARRIEQLEAYMEKLFTHLAGQTEAEGTKG